MQHPVIADSTLISFRVVCGGVAIGLKFQVSTIDPPAAFTDENLDGGEYFVPGTTLGGANGTTDFWKEVKEGFTNTPFYVSTYSKKSCRGSSCQKLLTKQIALRLGCFFVGCPRPQPADPLRLSRMRKWSCGHSGHFATGGAKPHLAALQSRRPIGK